MNMHAKHTADATTVEGGAVLFRGEGLDPDGLMFILELDMKFHAGGTAAVLDSLPITLQVEDIESIGRVTTDKEEAIFILVLLVGCAGILAFLGSWLEENLRFGS